MVRSQTLRVLAVLRTPEATESLQQCAQQVNGVKIDVVPGDISGLTDELVSYHKPSALLLDVNVNEQADLARLGQVVQQHGQRFSIIVTSRDSGDYRKRGAEAGADAYVTKGSFDHHQLLEMVHRFMTHGRGEARGAHGHA